MKLIDTHNHLYLDDFDSDRDRLVNEARKSGIEKILLPNIDITSINRMHELCNQYPCFAYPMMGLHPTSVNADYAASLCEIESHLADRSYCGIGEIGIDLYWDTTYLKEQILVFEEQLKWSIDLNLPVVIHTRDAFPYVFESIYKIGADKLTGVFHSFTGNANDLAEIKQLPDFKIGINGVITFKNANLAETLSGTDLNKILLETDAPYLSPVPYRGRRNEPCYIWKTAEKLADVFSTSLENVAKVTKKNTLELFKRVDKLI